MVRLRNISIVVLAVIGLCWILGNALGGLLHGALFETRIVRSVQAPDGSAVAEVTTTTGATVFTTRVVLRQDDARWTLYEAGDSSFVPPLHWANRDTLTVGLPCGPFRRLSNPLEGGSEHPVKVRFAHPDKCP